MKKANTYILSYLNDFTGKSRLTFLPKPFFNYRLNLIRTTTRTQKKINRYKRKKD